MKQKLSKRCDYYSLLLLRLIPAGQLCLICESILIAGTADPTWRAVSCYLVSALYSITWNKRLQPGCTWQLWCWYTNKSFSLLIAHSLYNSVCQVPRAYFIHASEVGMCELGSKEKAEMRSNWVPALSQFSARMHRMQSWAALDGKVHVILGNQPKSFAKLLGESQQHHCSLLTACKCP